MPSLLTPLEMPVIDGITMPRNLYVVLKEPALLAGMPYPGVFTPWDKIAAAVFSGGDRRIFGVSGRDQPFLSGFRGQEV